MIVDKSAVETPGPSSRVRTSMYWPCLPTLTATRRFAKRQAFSRMAPWLPSGHPRESAPGIRCPRQWSTRLPCLGRAPQDFDDATDDFASLGPSDDLVGQDARALQFSIDKRLHRGCNCLDAFGQVCLAFCLQFRRVPEQGLQRCLEAMRKIRRRCRARAMFSSRSSSRRSISWARAGFLSAGPFRSAPWPHSAPPPRDR